MLIRQLPRLAMPTRPNSFRPPRNVIFRNTPAYLQWHTEPGGAGKSGFRKQETAKALSLSLLLLGYWVNRCTPGLVNVARASQRVSAEEQRIPRSGLALVRDLHVEVIGSRGGGGKRGQQILSQFTFKGEVAAYTWLYIRSIAGTYRLKNVLNCLIPRRIREGRRRRRRIRPHSA